MSQGPMCKHTPPLSAYVDSPLVQLRWEPNNISRPVEICPDARAQLFTARMCYNSKENAIKKISIMAHESGDNLSMVLTSMWRAWVRVCLLKQSWQAQLKYAHAVEEYAP